MTAFVSKAFAYLVVGLRLPLILGWAVAVAAAVLFLPPLPSSGGFSDLIPAGSAALRADAVRIAFGPGPSRRLQYLHGLTPFSKSLAMIWRCTSLAPS